MWDFRAVAGELSLLGGLRGTTPVLGRGGAGHHTAGGGLEGFEQTSISQGGLCGAPRAVRGISCWSFQGPRA